MKTLQENSRQIKSERLIPLSYAISAAHSWHLQFLLDGGLDKLDILVLVQEVRLTPTHNQGTVVAEDGAVRLSISVEVASEQSNVGKVKSVIVETLTMGDRQVGQTG